MMSELTDIHDIKPPESIGFNPDYWRYGLIALAAGLVLLALWLLIRRYRRRQAAADNPLPPPPPEQTALGQLDQLARLIGSDGRGYYFGLSAVFREYLQGRFGLNAPEMTTEELLPPVSALNLARDLHQGVKTLLETSDPVKFAAMPTQRRFMQRDLEFVKAFVLRTTPTESDDNPESTGRA